MADIGIDVGGTFVDVVVRPADGSWHLAKTLIEGDSVEGAVRRAIDTIRTDQNLGLDASFVAHGTTVVTNLIIEECGSRVALVTTQGFRDVLEIGRQDRPALFDMRVPRRAPLVPRDMRLEVDERVAADGSVRVPLSLESVDAVSEVLADRQAEVAVVSLLHSVINPTHERAVGQRITERCPGIRVVLSSDLAQQYGEYERTSTAVLSGYVGPGLDRYLRDFAGTMQRVSVDSRVWVMQSSGGLATIDEIAKHPLTAQFSGPAAGVIAAQTTAIMCGETEVVTLDVGGTSADMAVIRRGVTELEHVRHVYGLPVLGTSIAVQSIGAGGGSIAWIDPGGLLKVGPRSAGARPGPACYGRGGTDPTVTDAHVVLGHVDTERPLGGALAVDRALAEQSLRPLAARLEITGLELAMGIVDVAIANITRAMRRITVGRGVDPEELSLVAFGGGGGLYVCYLLSELGFRRALVPPAAGALSAVGLLSASPRIDLSTTQVQVIGQTRNHGIAQTVLELGRNATSRLVEQGCSASEIAVGWQLEVRYAGQTQELSLGLAPEDGVTAESVGLIPERFHALHEATFGIAARGEPVELVTVHAIASSLRSAALPVSGVSGSVRKRTSRRIWEPGNGYGTALIVDRNELEVGNSLRGPVIVESDDSATAVLSGFRVAVLPGAVLEISKDEGP